MNVPQTAYEGPEWLSIPKAAKLAGVCRRTLDKWIRAQRVTVAYLPTGSPRIHVASLLRTDDVHRLSLRRARFERNRGANGHFASTENAVAVAPPPAARPVPALDTKRRVPIGRPGLHRG